MVGADDVETFLDPAAELILASPSPTRLAQACTRQGAPAADIPSAKKACAAGDADACASLGAAAMCRAHDADANANAEPALGTLERSCALGSDDGCHQFATALVAGNLGRRDVGRGLRVHHRACSNGSARACGSLGSVLVSIRKPAAISRGASYLEKACAGGYLDSCGSLAIIEASGAGSRAKNPERAATIARDACEKRNALSCGVLGALKVRGLGVAKDEASGVKLLAVACNAGEASGCTNLGICHYNGTGVARDIHKATELFEKGCGGGNKQACTILAEVSAAPQATAPSAANVPAF